jgi:predicted dehydrogenase
MRFALLGDHPDGLDMARALAASERHIVASYTGSPAGADALRRTGLAVKTVRDLEEVLADPSIEAVLVASPATQRAAHLRRALQSERHVLCVHPADDTPDMAYEAAMIQGDTRCVLLPLLPETLHPGVARLADLARADGPLGALCFVECERSSPDPVLLDATIAGHKPSLPGWDMLRAVGGEIAEVAGITAGEHASADEPLLLAGRFERAGLFQAALVPGRHESSWRLAVVGSYARAELLFPTGWPGPAHLRWQDETGTTREETWDAWNPWPPLVAVFEEAVAASRNSAPQPTTLTWQTAIRAQELDDAVRRSVERRRVSTLEYPEASEEVGFKGTMTLVGCGVLWGILVLVILARWFPWLGWVIVPVLVVFLGLQTLRWLVPAPRDEERKTDEVPGERRKAPP